MKKRACTVKLAAIFLLTGSFATTFPKGAAAPAILASSTFDGNNEGWQLFRFETGSSTADYLPTGGNPGGYISLSNRGSSVQIRYYQAPQIFLGDKSAAYGGTLRFDLKQFDFSGQLNEADVILEGGGIALYFDTLFSPGSSWTSYAIPLTETAGWINQLTGLPATESDIRSALSNLTRLLILDAFWPDEDTGGLDNVALMPGPPPPSSFRITGIAIGSQKTLSVTYEADTSSYYILHRGNNPSSIPQPVDATLGQPGEGTLIDSLNAGTSTAVFYRVLKIPLDQARDTDGDGMDDVYELQRQAFLNPLSASDAVQDFDKDGRSNYDEYRAGTEPGRSEGKTRLAAGFGHTLLLRADGTLWAWGDNIRGQLGNGTGKPSSAPLRVGTNVDWALIAAGRDHTLAIKHDGTLWGWGDNGFGQLGDGTEDNQPGPVKIGSATNWLTVAGGSDHTLAIRMNGTLWAWGNNVGGQLGDGTTVSSSRPTRIGMDHNWQAVAAGADHSVALKRDGTLWAWGDNGFGQLGAGTSIRQLSPIQVGSGNDWAAITTLGNHNLALKTDGSLWAWGDNFSGQLGNGTDDELSSPTRIGADNDWASIAAGTLHSAALKRDGTLWTWGNNSIGQLGNGTNAAQWAPVRIEIASNWALAASGDEHGSALQSDGSLWAWGANPFGQLGNGNITPQSSPGSIGTPSNW